MPTTASNTAPTPIRTDFLQDHFNALYPELNSRITRLSRFFRRHERDDARSEMIGFAWKNFVSKYNREGVLLSPGLLATMSFLWVRNGRTLADYTVCDVQCPMAFRMGRSRVLYLSQMVASKKRYALTDSETERIIMALSNSERERPDTLAAIRIDWSILAEKLDARLRRILAALAVGEKKCVIAKKLGITAGRLSQLLDDLADEIVTFFTKENLPSGLAL